MINTRKDTDCSYCYEKINYDDCVSKDGDHFCNDRCLFNCSKESESISWEIHNKKSKERNKKYVGNFYLSFLFQERGTQIKEIYYVESYNKETEKFNCLHIKILGYHDEIIFDYNCKVSCNEFELYYHKLNGKGKIYKKISKEEFKKYTDKYIKQIKNLGIFK